MAITGTSLKARFARQKKDISDVTDNVLIDWLDDLNRQFYNHLSGLDAERLISVENYTVTTNPQTAALPATFQSVQPWQCGFYKNTPSKIGFDTQTGDFTVGLTLTGGTSGATAVIESIVDNGVTGTLTLSAITGTFQDGEIVTDPSAGRATVDVYAVLTDAKLGRTHPGSTRVGYYLVGANIIFTGLSNSDVYTLRYLPKATAITALADELVVPDEYINYASKDLDVRYAVWDEDPGAESLADFRFVRTLDELTNNIKKAPDAYGLTDYSSIY